MLAYLLCLSVAVLLPAPSHQGACDASRPDNHTTAGDVVVSPGYPANYTNNALCEYRFVNTAGGSETPLVSFTEFRLETSTGCTKDSVTFYNGWDATAPLIGTYCGTALPPAVSSTQSALYMRFSSDADTNHYGFRAELSFADTACGTGRPGVITSPSGTLRTPNRGVSSTYPNNALCEWHFMAPAGQTIRFTFNSFDMEDCCTCDWFRMYDGSNTASRLYGSFYGPQLPPNFTSRSNNVYIQFQTDVSIVGAGVELSWQFM